MSSSRYDDGQLLMAQAIFSSQNPIQNTMSASRISTAVILAALAGSRRSLSARYVDKDAIIPGVIQALAMLGRDKSLEFSKITRRPSPWVEQLTMLRASSDTAVRSWLTLMYRGFCRQHHRVFVLLLRAEPGLTFQHVVQGMSMGQADLNDRVRQPSVMISECETTRVIRIIHLGFGHG